MSRTITSRSAASSGTTGSQTAAAGAEPVDQQQRLAAASIRRAVAGALAADRLARAQRQSGFAKSTWTSPIRRSRKPASEELR